MNKKLLFKTFFIFTLAFIVSSSVPLNTHAQILIQKNNDNSEGLKKQLLDLTRSKLNTENRILITGNPEQLTTTNLTLKGEALKQSNKTKDLLLARYKALADYGQHYTNIKSEIAIEKGELSEKNATLVVREIIEYTFDPGNSQPLAYPQEAKTHIFKFNFSDGMWSLALDEEIGGFTLTSPTSDAPKVDKSHAVKPDNENKKPQKDQDKTVIINAGTFNPGSAANYARQYWHNYNPAYRTYNDRGGDCTNFVSQALNWGGWQHIGA